MYMFLIASYLTVDTIRHGVVVEFLGQADCLVNLKVGGSNFQCIIVKHFVFIHHTHVVVWCFARLII